MSEEYECLKKEITDYLNKDSVEYALLLSGKWGTGKTYLINDILEGKSRNHGLFLKFFYTIFSFCLFLPKCILNILRFFLYAFLVVIFVILTFIWDGFINWFKWFEIIIYPERMRPRYLSLNGVSSIETLKALIVLSSTRNDAEKKLELITSAFSILETIKFFSLISNTYKKFIFTTRANNLNAPIIFDDLERCKIDGRELFGFIRTYQEKIKKPIVLVGDEDKFPKALSLNDDVYFEIKEKTIGRTLVKHANIREIIGKFLNGEKIEDNITKELKGICIEIFEHFQNVEDAHGKTYENLRAFQISLKEVLNYFNKINSNYKANQDFCKKFLKIGLALRYAVQVGSLTKENWERKIKVQVTNTNDDSSEEIHVITLLNSLKEYVIFYLNQHPVLKLENWKDILFGEKIDWQRINNSIPLHCEFFQEKNIRSFNKLKFYWSMTKSEIEDAEKELEQEIKNGTIVDLGDIFTAYGVKAKLLHVKKRVEGEDITSGLKKLEIELDEYIERKFNDNTLIIKDEDLNSSALMYNDLPIKNLLDNPSEKFSLIKDRYLARKHLIELELIFENPQKDDVSQLDQLLTKDCMRTPLFALENFITPEKFIRLIRVLHPSNLYELRRSLYERYLFNISNWKEHFVWCLSEKDAFIEINNLLTVEIDKIKTNDIYRTENYMDLGQLIQSIINRMNVKNK